MSTDMSILLVRVGVFSGELSDCALARRASPYERTFKEYPFIKNPARKNFSLFIDMQNLIFFASRDTLTII